MDGIIQTLRDIAEKRCLEAADRNDRDSADEWEKIAALLDSANRHMANGWRVIVERQRDVEFDVLSEVASELYHQASIAAEK